ncbi:MAG: methyl-accepting chemotaxis protein [Haloarculaceae archaeon]
MGPSLGRFDIRDSYGKKLAVLLLVTTVLVGGVGVGIYLTVDGELTENTEQQLQTSARNDATQVDNWMRLSDQQFVAATRSSAVRSGKTYRAQDQIARITSRDEIVGTYLVNLSSETAAVETGRVDITDEGDTVRPAIANRAARLVETTDQRVSYSAPFRLDDDRAVVLAVTETPSGDDRALVSIVDLSTLSSVLFGTGTEQDTTVTVVNQTGTVVLSNNRSALLTEDAVTAETTWNESGAVTQSAGERLAIGHADTEGHGWTATTRLPTSEAYGLRNTVSKQILLLLGVLVVGLGGIGLTLGRNTVREVRSLAERANTLRAGNLETAIESERQDEFGEVSRALDAMRRSLREEIADAEAAREQAESAQTRAQEARAEAEAARQDAVELNERLEATAAEFGAVMDDVAAGDLSRRLPTDAESDAMADIARAYNEMMNEWEETIRRVRSFGEAVKQASGGVATSVRDARETSATLADGMETIATDATDQATDLQTVRDEMQDLSASVEEASASTNEVATVAGEILDNGQAGREAAAAAMDELDEIEQRTRQAATQVEQLDALVADIEAVVDIIRTVAEQTNMLALNASIEAAHATGDGDGFAVVADEIKTLVEETQDATGEIEATIAELKSQTETTTTEMHAAREKVEAGSETIEDALDAFDSIVDDIDETVDSIREIDRATADQADSTQAVMSRLETVTEVSTETATAADTAATDARTQTERMAEVKGSVDSLAEQAQHLGDLLAAFETSAADSDPPAIEDETADQPALASGSEPSALPGPSGTATADGGTENVGDD